VTARLLAGVAALARARLAGAALAVALAGWPAAAPAAPAAPATPAVAVPGVTAISADAIRFDLSPARELLSLWHRRTGRAQAAERLAQGLPYRTLRMFLAEQWQCALSTEDLTRALADPDSGSCGVALHFPYRDRASLDSLVTEILARSAAIRGSAAARASEYLPPGAADRPVRVWFLVATQYTFDAATLRVDADGDSTPVVLVNLADVLPYAGSTRERVDELGSVLAHETFHAVLRQIQPRSPGWGEFIGPPRDAFSYIAGIMLDEGVAHYIDWKQRPGADTLFAAKPCSRERFAFSQLAIAARRLEGGSMDGWDRIETLQLAANGPLWSKYGAISGMFAAFRIERALGRDALIKAVVDGPAEFLRLYAEAGGKDPEIKPLPTELAAVK
jgi:putative zinc-dependent peptidase DUF5700